MIARFLIQAETRSNFSPCFTDLRRFFGNGKARTQSTSDPLDTSTEEPGPWICSACTFCNEPTGLSGMELLFPQQPPHLIFCRPWPYSPFSFLFSSSSWLCNHRDHRQQSLGHEQLQHVQHSAAPVADQGACADCLQLKRAETTCARVSDCVW